MILIDANLLLHAYNPRAAEHEASKTWLEAVLSGPELVRFTWLTLWAFLRISMMDAVLAAIAIEHGATLNTTDRDFARFPGLAWVNPIGQR
jgi:predicted nucleic acid-binding protein